MVASDPHPIRKAIFLDRDGTLILDKHYLSDPAAVELLPGVATTLQEFIAHGYLLFLFSNQSGIARKLYTAEDVAACNRRMLELLNLPSPGFTDSCIAPEGPDDPLVYRKPSPRFILESIGRYGLDPSQCWMVGDKASDVQAGLNAGVHAALLTGSDTTEAPAGVVRCRDLKEFATRLFAGQL